MGLFYIWCMPLHIYGAVESECRIIPTYVSTIPAIESVWDSLGCRRPYVPCMYGVCFGICLGEQKICLAKQISVSDAKICFGGTFSVFLEMTENREYV